MQPLIPTWEIEARQRERKANKVAKNKRQEREAKREVNQWWKQKEGAGFGQREGWDGNYALVADGDGSNNEGVGGA